MKYGSPTFLRSDPITGFVACEDGKKCACTVAWREWGYRPGKCPELDDLIKRHEKKHFHEVVCEKGCKPKLQIAPWKPGVNSEKSECERAKQDIKDLEKLATKLSGECQETAKAMLAWKKEYYKEHKCEQYEKHK